MESGSSVPEAGRGQTGADALSRGGKTLEHINSDAAYRLYTEASREPSPNPSLFLTYPHQTLVCFSHILTKP
eukprot:1182503-Prorocentrum_minimum.AAC.5